MAPGSAADGNTGGGISRRSFLSAGARAGALAGLGLLGGAALAPTADAATKSVKLVKASKVPPGSAFAFTDPFVQVPAYLVHLGTGKFRAYSRICTHAGCVVEYVGSKFACPCHGSEFSTTTGAVVRGPARRALPQLPVVVRSGEIYIRS